VYKNHSNEQNNYTNASETSFEDVQLDNPNEQYFSPSDQHNHLIQSKIPTPKTSPQKQNSTQTQKRHNVNEQISKADHQQTPSDADSNGVFLLLDANEHLTVR
jgi:hypothetical protein